MSEFDAFGRKVGEDPLEQLGWNVGHPVPPPQPHPASTGDPLAQTVPTPPGPDPLPHDAPVMAAPPPAWTPAPSASSTFGRRRRFPIGRIIFLAIVGAIVYGAFQIVGSVTDTVRTAVDSLPSIPTPVAPIPPGTEEGDEAPAPPSRPPRGLSRASLVRPENLRRAVQRLRAEKGGLRSLSVRPERLNAQLLTRGGRLKNVQITHEGGIVSTTSGSGFGAPATIPFARVNTKAGARLVRAAARRLKRSTNGLDYIALLEVGGGPPVWGAYFKNGGIFIGDPQGRILRRIG